MIELPNEIYGAGVLCDGQWHHVAARFDGGAWSVYIDGTLYPLTGGDPLTEGDE